MTEEEETVNLDEEDMEIYDYHSNISINSIDDIDNAVYDIMIDFKEYVSDVSLPLIENLDYLYLFDYIDSLIL